MPLLVVTRLLFSLLSWLILGAAAYLLWSWYRGELVLDIDGSYLGRAREDWRLWAAVVLLAWSFLGRVVVLPLAARPNGRLSRSTRSSGRLLTGASGATLYVEVHGPESAPPIIFTHGWGLDSTIWNYAKEDLAKRFRVITWDLPGLGLSKSATIANIDLTSFATDLAHIIKTVDGRPAILVGHSIGGMTIQTLARDHPYLFNGQVAGVVLLNTTYTNPLKTMVLSAVAQAIRWPVLEPALRLAIWLQPLAWLGAWQSYLSGSAHLANRIGFGKYVTRSQLEHTTLLATRNPPGVQAKGMLAMFRWDATEALRDIKAPALIVSADMDLATKEEASAFISAHLPAAALRVVEGVNHMGFLERADAYNDLIAEFALSVQPTDITGRRGVIGSA